MKKTCIPVLQVSILRLRYYWKVPEQRLGASHVVFVVKNPPADGGHVRDMGSIPESGRSSAGGNGKPPQCCLQNAMDR